MAQPQKYSREVRQNAVALLREQVDQYDSEWEAMRSVAGKIGVPAETLRKWACEDEVDDGHRHRATSEESAELKRLRRENAELRRANEILKAASGGTEGSTTVSGVDATDARSFVEVIKVLGAILAAIVLLMGSSYVIWYVIDRYVIR
ncbi:transposase-like protein [Nocardia sp. GAS34]|uniref:transposase n=1 Tax=unclassified Nocardia TaxID=2637762 RepID=UPI003D2588C5